MLLTSAVLSFFCRRATFDIVESDFRPRCLNVFDAWTLSFVKHFVVDVRGAVDFLSARDF